MCTEEKGYNPLETTPWDPTDYITTEEDVLACLNVALEEGDDLDLRLALRDIARAYSMGKVAEKAGVSRESLYRSLSAEGNPRFTTVMRVLDALGYTIEVKPKRVGTHAKTPDAGNDQQHA